ncbi:putative salicylate hydroxylase [Phyllosticta capitalensis]|uniref:Salicylate hydroxylase n=1 Tax=Phyllosticta capitalensis TaxID=121624 RepID=A0ABR1YQG3_9PEZI
MTYTPKIAIIGAGPSGLTLARLLHCSGIPSVVFESDPTPESRTTYGGSIDLHEDSGQLALREAGLWDEFQKLARYEGEDRILKDRFNNIAIEQKDLDTGRPEIDRKYLRDMLLNSIPPEYMRWDHRLKEVSGDGTLRFSNGVTAAGFDLVVGADGAWSKVQRLLSTIRPFYTGVSAIELWYHDIDSFDPDMNAMIGHGSHFCFGEETGRCLLTQRQDNGVVRTLACMRVPEEYLADKGVENPDRDGAVAFLLREFGEWAPELKRLLTKSNGPVYSRPFYMLPVGFRWPHKKGFTLIGDSCHLMTPFAGIGVNMAMQDSLELAHAIIANKDGELDAAIHKFEKTMWPRAEKAAKLTWESTLSRFDSDGIKVLQARLEMALASRGELKKREPKGSPPAEKVGELKLED